MENGNNINKPKIPSLSNKNIVRKSEPKPMYDFSKTTKIPTKITRAEKIPQTAVAPKNLKKFFIILTSVLLALLIGVGVTLYLMFPRPVRPSDISINFRADVDVAIRDSLGVLLEDQNLETTRALPGDKIDYSFKLYTEKNEESTDVNLDVFLRIKAGVYCGKNFFPNTVELTFIDNDMWFKGGDGYYYLKKTDTSDGVLSPGERIELTRNLQIDKSLGNEFAGKDIRIVLEADVLQAQYQAIDELWPTAPSEWASQFRDLTW